ncbi:hypothetical protein [Caballeronia sp. LZ034LL]|uniref:hypothetical protein n=1 Tax=Caballeronia sp. LZ034LL TaxID=3038567 RepID=UPI002861AD81|nr:hypothetical protein [Caballeronia sp. LZ034LL]MDR5839296.1 hypothetical protein [Caballeronia sp. LZ034LL]
MLSEAEYRQRLDQVFIGSGPNWAQGGAEWNNQMILNLAIHGLVLLPRYGSWGGTPPFKHYIEMAAPSAEQDENGHYQAAWKTSWIVDADWEEHYKPPLKFQFTPLKKS